ncbi:Cdc6/Cdc18 family protein [Halomicrobium urmianum]|uniref:Cdc6/Cdc18 family protein n=1 Tax=Halomicrobium urmianum TaxID=1586233 RepID=UPI001CD95DD2|nr:orc1/cdc6 family replication initiation protein [Halomicrobium urmianum]
MPSDDNRDPLFRYDDPIFVDEDMLKISHIPQPDRIVGRDEQMQKVVRALNPAIMGSEPTNLLIFGKTGTGKSLISRAVTERMQAEAERNDTTVESVFIDCGEHTTEVSVVKQIASALNKPISGVSVPKSGISQSDYYERLWRILNTCCDVAVIILDEIDMLADDEVLRKLSRAGENKHVSTPIGIIGVSNKIDYPDELSERVQSSFNRDELVFPAYDADQLIEILEHRRDAFKEGVLDDGAIPLTAALAAQDHGDARKAIDILRNAGRIARDEESTTVTEEHVRAAQSKTEADRFDELVNGAPLQAKLIILTLARLHRESEQNEFVTETIYKTYRQLAEQIDVEPRSERRVQEILQEQDFLNVIQSDRRGRGRGKGVASYHRLLEDVNIVEHVLNRDGRLRELVDTE